MTTIFQLRPPFNSGHKFWGRCTHVRLYIQWIENFLFLLSLFFYFQGRQFHVIYQKSHLGWTGWSELVAELDMTWPPANGHVIFR